MIVLEELEQELKKRLALPYCWSRKQSDDWDTLTNFIYKTPYFDALQEQVGHLQNPLKQYALNRWLNFWSAKAIEYIFAMDTKVIPCTNVYDKYQDFTIEGIAFDHKTTIFPKGLGKNLADALKNKRELITWLYQNQSQQGRKHYHNRLFVVLHRKDQQHWKLKAEISFIQAHITTYLQHFSKENLEKFNFDQQEIVSDIIWITQ